MLPGNPWIPLNSFTAYSAVCLKGEDLRTGYNAGSPTVGIFIGGNVNSTKESLFMAHSLTNNQHQ